MLNDPCKRLTKLFPFQLMSIRLTIPHISARCARKREVPPIHLTYHYISQRELSLAGTDVQKLCFLLNGWFILYWGLYYSILVTTVCSFKQFFMFELKKKSMLSWFVLCNISCSQNTPFHILYFCKEYLIYLRQYYPH